MAGSAGSAGAGDARSAINPGSAGCAGNTGCPGCVVCETSQSYVEKNVVLNMAINKGYFIRDWKEMRTQKNSKNDIFIRGKGSESL